MASNITHSTTNIDHCVKRWTPPETLQQQHDGVLAGKNHNNAPVVEFAVTPQRDNTDMIQSICKAKQSNSKELLLSTTLVQQSGRGGFTDSGRGIWHRPSEGGPPSPPPQRENSYSRLGDVVVNVAQPLPRREDSYARLGDVVPIKNTQFVNLIPTPPATTTTMTPSHNGGGGNFTVHWRKPPYNSNMNTNYKNSDREGRPWFPPTPPPPPHHNHRRDEFRPAVNNNYYYTNNNIDNNENRESLGFNDEQYGLPTDQQKHDNISDDRITTYGLVEGYVDDIDRGGGEVGEFYHRGNNRRSDKSESSLLLLSERVKCISRSHKNLRDAVLDDIIKEMETSTVLMELNLNRNQITLADGRFTAALASNTSLLRINLRDNKIGDEGVRSLCAALKINNTLTSISLDINQITTVGAQFLAEALMINNMLRYLDMNGNRIGEDGAQSLAMALKVNNTLRSINLNQNQISNVGVKFLADAFMANKMLENLNLSTNVIGNEGARYLSVALKVNKTLKSMDLNKNQISTVGAKFFADALMVNTSLLSINLSHNNIDDEGAQSLAESFTKNRSLRNMQLSTNRITDIGATQLADAIEFNCDCVLTTISLKGNKVSISLLDRIKSICKAKQSNVKELLSSTTLVQQSGQWTPPETLQHDGVLVGEQHNPVASAVTAVTPQRDNTPQHNSNRCIKRNKKKLQDKDLDEIIKELEKSTTISEIILSNNRITLVDGRFTTALASNTILIKISLLCNKIGDKGARSLASALKVNNTLQRISLSGNMISNVGAKFLASALMVNTSLLSINLSHNNIDDEGAQRIAESFAINRSLCCVQLCNNRITDIGTEKLADSLRLNVDCGVTTINLKGNQISASLLDMIESICKAKQSKGKELSSSTTLVQQSTSHATLLHDGVLAGEQHDIPGVDAVTQSKLYNTNSDRERDECIIINNKNLHDEDLDDIIKELETNAALSEIKLSNNLMTLADGRFTTALASNTSLQRISLPDNNISNEGTRSLASSLKNNNTLVSIVLSGNQISKVGAKFLAEALMVNKMLENLNLNDNMIGDEGTRYLSLALKVNKTLTSISLDTNQITTVGEKFLAEMLMINKMLRYMSVNGKRIGDEGAQSLCAALKVNTTLTRINLDCNQISKVGVKFLASALMVNTSLLSIDLSHNNIDDEGAQILAESFTENRSLCSIKLRFNDITDIGATKLADAIEVNFDCVVTTINLNGNKVSISLLDRIKSICKASNDTFLTVAQKARDRKRKCKLQIVDTIASRNKKHKLQIVGTNASKDDQIALLKEHIALLEKDNARLNDNLRQAKPIVETIDLTTDEAERATKRTRTETDVKSNLAIMYEQNQKIVQIKQENVATKLANHTVMSTFKELSADLEDAHAILHEQTQKVIHIKKEKMDTEIALESIRGEKNVVEADLKEVKEDLEDANELVGQMSLTTDIWQGRFDELVALVESGNADGASINAIRNRPLASGK